MSDKESDTDSADGDLVTFSVPSLQQQLERKTQDKKAAMLKAVPAGAVPPNIHAQNPGVGAPPLQPRIEELEDAQDDVFGYDPGFQEDPNQPFTESEEDDDDVGSNDNSFADDETDRASLADARLYSTSVPISVPQFKSLRQQQQLQRHDERDSSDTLNMNPDEMAASIQALARSVHGDSAMVFGELPKSRTRTSTTRTLSSQGSTSSGSEK